MESAPSAPRHLAHYELLEELGRGGMGIVYEARDTRLDRRVAIKVLPALFAGDPDRRARLLREAKAAARLHHPNIATLFELGEADWPTEEGDTPRRVVYLAMERVEGEDLAPRLERGPLPVEEALSYGLQIAEALEAAHRSGVIHRDLKPQNLRITPEGRIKILDFGLAKLVQDGTLAGEESEPFLTAQGAIMGTAPYMAPEQLQGSAEVDGRSDLFSFGVVLYQMLTGRLPFDASRLVDYAKALGRQKPKLASKVNPGVPARAARLLQRLLARDPERRPQSATEVRETLHEVSSEDLRLLGPSGSRRGDSLFGSIFGEALESFGRPWVGWAVGLVLLLALVGTAWWTTSRQGGGSGLRGDEGEVAGSAGSGAVIDESFRAVHLPPFEDLTGDQVQERLCRGLGLALGTHLQEIPVVVVAEAEDAETLGVPMRLEGACRAMDDGEASVLLSLVDRGSGASVWGRSFEGPQERVLGEMTLRVAEALGVAVSPRMQERLEAEPGSSAAALSHYLRGLELQDHFEDRAALEEAVAELRQAVRLDPGFAHAWAGLSEALRRLAWKRQDQGLLDESEGAAREALDHDPELPAARLALERLLSRQGRLEEALAELEALVAQQPNHLTAQVRLAETRFRLGRLDEAAEGLDRALQRVGLPAESLWRPWNQLAGYLAEIGNYEGAAESYRRAAELAPPGVSVPLENLGGLEIIRGRPEEAAARLEEVTRERLTFPGVINLGTAYFMLGQFEEALELYSRAIELRPDEPAAYRNRGDTYQALGRSEEAQADFDQAVRSVEGQLEIDPSNARLQRRRLVYLAKSGACGEVLSDIETMVDTVPESPEHLLAFAQAEALCDRDEPALGHLSRALEQGIARKRVCKLPEVRHLCERL